MHLDAYRIARTVAAAELRTDSSERALAPALWLPAARLAAVLERPSDELVAWGSRACNGYRRSGEAPEEEATCCACLCNLMAFVGLEQQNAPFASRLVELGRELGQPQRVLRGFEHWIDGAIRAERRDVLEQISGDLHDLVDTVAHDEDRRAWLQELIERANGGAYEPPPRAAMRRTLLGHPSEVLILTAVGNPEGMEPLQ